MKLIKTKLVSFGVGVLIGIPIFALMIFLVIPE